MTPAPERSLVVVIDDLLFETKVRGTAGALGIAAWSVRDVAGLQRQLDETRPPLVIVDLNVASGGPAAVAAAVAHPCRPTVIAFVSHVQADLIAQGRAAGAHLVLPRSKFSAELPALLAEHSQPTAP